VAFLAANISPGKFNQVVLRSSNLHLEFSLFIYHKNPGKMNTGGALTAVGAKYL
jgi:hypothetical protein